MKRITENLGVTALKAVTDALAEGREATSCPEIATAVRYSLQIVADSVPGHTVELRIPPYSAVQVIEGGNHRRGTPPNVVEMDADTWFQLTTGRIDWDTAKASGKLTASGSRADEIAKIVPKHLL